MYQFHFCTKTTFLQTTAVLLTEEEGGILKKQGMEESLDLQLESIAPFFDLGIPVLGSKKTRQHAEL